MENIRDFLRINNPQNSQQLTGKSNKNRHLKLGESGANVQRSGTIWLNAAEAFSRY